MADYTPVFLPGEAISLTASGTIAAGDLVEVSGNGTVAKVTSLASVKVVGVAGNDAAATARVTVYARGPVHESVADGTVTAGDLVTSTNTASRQVKTLATYAAALNATFSDTEVEAALNAVAAQGKAVLGVALITAADNVKVRWMSF